MNEWNDNGQNGDNEEEQTPVYVWDGKKPDRKPGGKKIGKFCAVAVACLLVAAAVCIPTVLGRQNMPVTGTSSAESSSAAEASSMEASTEETSRYEISQTVQISGDSYTEASTKIEVYEKCSPSCVTIYVTFGDRYAGQYAIGSGFVLTEDGYIATNQHVVDGGAKFKVIFYDGTEYDAEKVGEDSQRDLAVLKIDAKDLKPLAIGNSENLKVGQTVIAIGTPYDKVLAGTMTQGSISGLNREIPITNSYGTVIKTMRLIQTDASINPGNSGGPLINLNGQVIGINSLKLTNDYEGIGFAIPINYAVEIFNQLIQYGEVVQDPDNDFITANARLGVTVYNLQTGLDYFRLRPKCDYPKEGILVASVEPNTAVYEAGLQVYNIITEFAGVPIKENGDLSAELAKHKAGETVTMKVFAFSRNFSEGEYRELTFVLDAAS